MISEPQRNSTSSPTRTKQGHLVDISEKASVSMIFRGEMRISMVSVGKKLQDSQKTAIFAILLSVFIIYIILTIQFESFLIPLKIIPIIPISAAFSISILFLFKMSLNLAVYIGLIVLSGVVVNNTILITEGIKYSEKITVFSLNNVIRTRIKPVFITTSTTILALLPLIFQRNEGSELWRPLAITLVVGLIYGTFINLSVYPVIFLQNKSKKIKLLFKKVR